ncbi:hypothetical protein ABZX69_35780 [Streptomyces sp. NPDC004074]|uniref:hypothetical protein n=1 Tax=unclassified Streptomyces TaxID=2593676 RepID=UPI0033BDA894
MRHHQVLSAQDLECTSGLVPGRFDQSLTEHGVDFVALAARHGLRRQQLTNNWWK